jgi:predicted metal-dependent peptidase
MDDMTTVSEETTLHVQAGRALAVMAFPYFRRGLFAMTYFPVVHKKMKTASIDARWRVSYNEAFIMSLTPPEVAWVWMHELGHPLRMHHSRFLDLGCAAYLHKQYNQAGDAAINEDLRGAKGISAPALKVWYPESIPGATVGMTTEQMFHLLVSNPAATAQGKNVEVVLDPRSLRYSETEGTTITAWTARRIYTGTPTITLTGVDGEEIDGAVTQVTVEDVRKATFVLATPLEPGAYEVTITCGGETVSTTLSVTGPTIRMRPDHVQRGYTAPLRLVVEGNDTRFAADTTIEILDAQGEPVDGGATDVRATSQEFLAFNLGQVPDGIYGVRVTAGGEVSTTTLPVGVPWFELRPPSLPSGFGVPRNLAGIADDFTFDATTEIQVLAVTPFGFVPLPDVAGDVTVHSATSVTIPFLTTLPDGSYVVTATTGTETAMTVLAVGGDSDEDSDDDSEDGEGGEDGTGGTGGTGESEDGEGDGGGQGEGDGGSGSDADNEDSDADCGSGSGGGQRPWERDLNDASDGSVSPGRAERLRQAIAQDVKDHVQAHGIGSVPAGVQRWAEDILDPQGDWISEMLTWVSHSVSAIGHTRHTYTKIHRRTWNSMGRRGGVVYPGRRGPQPPEFAGVIDTSMSMGKHNLGQGLGELSVVARRLGRALRILTVDAAASEPQAIHSIADIKLIGGGGTDMRVGIEAAANLIPTPDVIAVFTDGDTEWPTEPPQAAPNARYLAVLVDGRDSNTPPWMHKIIVDPRQK